MILSCLPIVDTAAIATAVMLLLVCLAGLVAILHPQRQRRTDALRVLALLLSAFGRNGKR